MSTETKKVAPADAGLRLDLWLAQRTSAKSRGRAKKALASGKVSVDGAEVGPTHGGQPVAAGAEVTIAWTKPGTGAPHAAAKSRLHRAGVEILYVDDDIVVVNKPAGLLTDTATRAQARSRDSLRKQLTARLAQHVWPAHRIDRDTSGVVAFARSEAVAAKLRAQWAERTPERVYLVVVEGKVETEEDTNGGTWADWMAWDARGTIQRPSEKGAEHAVLAQATWSVRKRGKGFTVLEVQLISGRRNQIRVHAMLRGHPLVGEVQYRRGKNNRSAPKLRRQALHALRLGFRHPNGEAMSFEAPVPDDLKRFLGKPA